MNPTADDLDGYDNATVYAESPVVRVSIRRTDDEAYPSGWRYTLHYGALSARPETLDDGTIRRYDNSHEDTKDHELHVAPDPEPETVKFPGIKTLYEQFWDEISKPRFGSAVDTDDTND